MVQQLLLRLPAVIAATQLSRSTIYAFIQSGDFPNPVKIGKRAVRWRSSDIEVWLRNLDTRKSHKREN